VNACKSKQDLSPVPTLVSLDWTQLGDAAHGEAIAKLEDIAEIVHYIYEQLDEITDWRDEHQRLHDIQQ